MPNAKVLEEKKALVASLVEKITALLAFWSITRVSTLRMIPSCAVSCAKLVLSMLL